MKDFIQLETMPVKASSLFPGDVFILSQKMCVMVNSTDEGYLVKQIPAGDTFKISRDERVKIVTEALCESAI
tara:strand:+ start:2101 stop:2316 length:216 start_codon:yes stop_codon:yes gene_type:complete